MRSNLATINRLIFPALIAACTHQAAAWTPGVGFESSSFGFYVDTQSRNDVISFWHSVYKQSEGYETRINWTGSVNSGTPGTTSSAFKNDVERRINYYRAMAGLPANIRINSSLLTVSGGPGPDAPAATTKEQAAQASALMLSANTNEFIAGGGVSTGAHNPHDPPISWSLDSSTARNGAYYSNLAIGRFGPGAIDAYMLENAQNAAGEENSDVGHRRYILYSRLNEVATGDVTANGNTYFSANSLYIIGDLLPPASNPRFTPWPNSGFIPEELVPERWSLSYPGADFSSAVVSMKDQGGNNVSTTVISRNASYADNTIAWIPHPAALPSAEASDLSFDITVSNILISGIPTSHSYTVTAINPNRLTEYPVLTGGTSIPDSGARFYFNQLDHAEEYDLEVTAESEATWTEGAEDSTSSYVTDGTSNNYELRTGFFWSTQSKKFWDTGDKAFRLAFPNNILPLSRESFILHRTIIPRSGASVSFRLRRGYMTADSIMEVQYSSDAGGTWNTLQQYHGKPDGTPDSGFATENVNLAPLGNQILIRFLFHQPAATGVYDVVTFPDLPCGVFIDNISLSNCDWLETLARTTYPKTANYVTLDETTGGGSLQVGQNYNLRLRPRIGNAWLPYGPSVVAVPVDAASLSPYEEWFNGTYPIIGNFDDDFDNDGLSNGIEHLLNLDPTNPADATAALSAEINNGKFEISHPVIIGAKIEAECSATLENGSWIPVSVTTANGIATASVDISSGGGRCFIRWKATE